MNISPPSRSNGVAEEKYWKAKVQKNGDIAFTSDLKPSKRLHV